MWEDWEHREENTTLLTTLKLIVIVFLLLVISAFSFQGGFSSAQKEAVRCGAAKYELNKKTGETEIVWIKGKE